MHSLVTLSTADGIVRRYERDGSGARLTHEGVLQPWPNLSNAKLIIEGFRTNPPPSCSIPQVFPGGFSPSGGSPAAMAA